ncbi:hypothetical protein P5673_019367 [Acropora cervicornis]|uniref:ShKT domain-containing protein n=1 Tax=Acropora cervicornis TaxID=6130 RepID=A0AAD9V2D9_ACRCE|nr:hypothetical protein P5673_019367 [Acropora cervicornis]
MSRAEWMNGVCLIWSRGRLISPSLPVGDDRYLNLSSQKRPTGRNLGGNRLVRRSGTTSRVNTCEDSDRKLCKKILTLYGNEACTNTHDKSLQNAVQKVCQSTCGFCIKDCQDQSRDLCEEYKTYCRKEGALGNLLADICPKTCNNCQLRPSKSENNWVIIDG